jgi:hypothetical protein
VAAARTTLGDDDFQYAWSLGRSLALDQALAEALTPPADEPQT